jgi:GPH family glycoside/pentoside/hexuronide:cation symporter
MRIATLLSNVNPIHIGWSVGTLGVSLLLNTSNIATLFFLVTVLQIEPIIAGALITGSKLYDAFTDPLMGTISDRTRSRWGRRRPYLIFGGIACGISFAALFSLPPIDNPTMLYLAVGLALVLLSTAYTIYNVPYLAMPTEMIDDYHERSVMMSYRSFLIAIGTFIGISATPFALAMMQEEMGLTASEAYRNMGIGIGTLMTIAMVGAFFGTSRAKFTEPVVSQLSIGERVRLILNNKQFLLFLGIKLTGLFSLASVVATSFFFVTYVMERSIGIATFYGIATLIAQVLGIPVWLALAKRQGKSRILVYSGVGTLLLALTWLLSGPQEPIWIYVLRGFALGLISGGTLLGTQAIFPDIIELDYRRTGLRREGVFAGTISFIEKTAGALSGVVIGTILSLMNFDKSLPPGEQPESAILGIMLCTAIVPALMSLIKLWILRYFSLSEEQLKNTVRVT